MLEKNPDAILPIASITKLMTALVIIEKNMSLADTIRITKEDAKLASEVLSMSDIRGIDSHGVARLHTYFDMLENKRINPKPNIKIIYLTLLTRRVLL